MQVQHVCRGCPGTLELAGPGADLPLIVEVIEAGEHRIRRSRSFLERRVDRRSAWRAFVLERRISVQRGRETHRADVVAVERVGVAVWIGLTT